MCASSKHRQKAAAASVQKVSAFSTTPRGRRLAFSIQWRLGHTELLTHMTTRLCTAWWSGLGCAREAPTRSV